tara:strand:+ start:9083 stop:10009 length:927 start_codon:yes stop_codon:yes gene_type:complete
VDLNITHITDSDKSRVVAVHNDTIYDLNKCCSEKLIAENTSNASSMANTLIPSNLKDFLNSKIDVINQSQKVMEWATAKGIQEVLSDHQSSWKIAEKKLESPIISSSKIIMIGDTYISHADRAGISPPDRPGIFFKMSQVVIGNNDWIIYPKNYYPQPLKFDTELAVVIGKSGMSIPEDQIQDHIWGYTICNDLTLSGAKDLGPRYKCFETSAPIGPWIVPKAQLKNPLDLHMEFRINGKTVQEGHTSNLIFSIESIISEVSEYHKLSPGDIISLGGPGPTTSLNPGDIVEAEIESIGILSNPVKLED